MFVNELQVILTLRWSSGGAAGISEICGEIDVKVRDENGDELEQDFDPRFDEWSFVNLLFLQEMMAC